MTPQVKPSSVAKIVRNMLEKCSMSVEVTVIPADATSWENEGIADTAVEVGKRTAVIPGYDGQLQAVKIVNGEYRDIGYTSRSPQKVAVRAIAAYVQMCLKCKIEQLI